MNRSPMPPKQGGVAAPAFFLCLVAAASGFALDFSSAPIFGLPAAWMAVAVGAGAALFAVCAAHLVRLALKARPSGEGGQRGGGDAGAHT